MTGRSSKASAPVSASKKMSMSKSVLGTRRTAAGSNDDSSSNNCAFGMNEDLNAGVSLNRNDPFSNLNGLSVTE